MAFEANLAGLGQRHHARLAAERERAFRSAKRHSRFVQVLRLTLPALAVLVLGAYFISTRMNVTVGDVAASIDGMEIADGNLRMLNPTLKGADKKNGDYVVRADYADQDVKNPNLIKLHGIKADVTNPDGGWSKMQAVRGKFDSKTERLIMKDRITVATSAGLTGALSYATLDMATKTLRSHNPVHFELPTGTVRANAMTLQSSEDTIVFRGNVSVQLGGPKQPGKAAPNLGAAPPQSAPLMPEADAHPGAGEGLAAAP